MTAASRFAARAIRVYQRFLSPCFPTRCRFAPTCSEYARVVFLERGFLRGAGLTAWRLLRCQPFHPGGYDPPPGERRRGP